jgi:serine/threonine-protein kinase
VLIEGRNAFLTDFGLTKRVEGTHAQLTRAGDMVGTIHYVAPEQIEGRKVSARSDVYSLGCLLYHCLSGQVPFALETDVAVIYAHLSEDPPKLSELRPELPDGLDAVMAKALDKSPDRRFPSCVDMISAARAVIDAAGPLSETIPPRPSAVATAATPEIRNAAAAARRPRVLLGGLDDRTRAVARVALGDRVDVLEAPAQGTAETAREERPDLVILDWAGSGAAGIAALRGDDLTRDAKVLLLVSDNAGREAATAGADDRLAAPFSPLQLQVKLRRLLGAEVIGG